MGALAEVGTEKRKEQILAMVSDKSEDPVVISVQMRLREVERMLDKNVRTMIEIQDDLERVMETVANLRTHSEKLVNFLVKNRETENA